MTEPEGDVDPELNIDAHTSVGQWFEEARGRGFMVPLKLCQGVSRAMRALDLTFPEAFRFLWRHRKILQEGRVLVYDLSASRLWEGRDA